MTTRICIREGQYVEIFVPEEYKADIMQHDKYPELRKLILDIIGAEK